MWPRWQSRTLLKTQRTVTLASEHEKTPIHSNKALAFSMNAGSAALPLTVLIQIILFTYLTCMHIQPVKSSPDDRSDTINVEILTCLLQIFDI